MADQGTYKWACKQASEGKAIRRACWPWCYFLTWDETFGPRWDAIVELAPTAFDPERESGDGQHPHRLAAHIGMSIGFPAHARLAWLDTTDWEVCEPTWSRNPPASDKPDFVAMIPRCGLTPFRGTPPPSLTNSVPFYFA